MSPEAFAGWMVILSFGVYKILQHKYKLVYYTAAVVSMAFACIGVGIGYIFNALFMGVKAGMEISDLHMKRLRDMK